MDKNKIIITAYLLIFIPCCYSQQKKNIVGAWYLKKEQASYTFLHFYDDSAASFSTWGDTTYRFKYYVGNSFLFTRDRLHQIDSFKILKLNRRKLVFQTFRENQTIQRYYKRAPRYWREEIKRRKKMSYRRYIKQLKQHPPKRGGIYGWNF